MATLWCHSTILNIYYEYWTSHVDSLQWNRMQVGYILHKLVFVLLPLIYMGSLLHKTWHTITVVFILMKYDPLKTRSRNATTISTAINESNKLHNSLLGCSHDVAEWVEWIAFNERIHTSNFCRGRCRTMWMGFSTNDKFSASFMLHSSRVNDKAPYAAVCRDVQFHLIQRSVTVQ